LAHLTFGLGVLGMVGSGLKDRFHILKRIASGGFGETFLAQDTHNMNNPCVVKRLLTQSDPSVQKLFDLEAKKLYNLKHEGIPKLIAYFEDGGQFYLVQDFVDGHTLNQEINSTTKWTESQVIDFLLEALEILAYVHSQGSIHRDLKPDNMMRRHADRKLVMIDFGAVREVRQTPSNMAIGAASFAQTVIGTKGYMPAEQAHGEPQFASDVYAIGCIAIYALTGVSPENFEKDNYEIRWRHLVQVSNRLGGIIDKMVRYDVRYRYMNADKVLTDLNALSINRNKPVIPNPPPVIPVSVSPPVATPKPVNKTPYVPRPNPPVLSTRRKIIIPQSVLNKTPYVPRPNPPVLSTRRKFIIGLAVATPLAIVSWDWWKPKPSVKMNPPSLHYSRRGRRETRIK
jgi:serine/threonine-protein kinase